MTHRCTKCNRSADETKFSLRDSRASKSTLRSRCCECSNEAKRKKPVVQPLHPEAIVVMRLLREWTTAKDVAMAREAAISTTRMIISRLMVKGYVQEMKRDGVRGKFVCLTAAGVDALDGPQKPAHVEAPPITSNPWEALGWNKRPNWRAAA